MVQGIRYTAKHMKMQSTTPTSPTAPHDLGGALISVGEVKALPTESRPVKVKLVSGKDRSIVIINFLLPPPSWKLEVQIGGSGRLSFIDSFISSVSLSCRWYQQQWQSLLYAASPAVTVSLSSPQQWQWQSHLKAAPTAVTMVVSLVDCVDSSDSVSLLSTAAAVSVSLHCQSLL